MTAGMRDSWGFCFFLIIWAIKEDVVPDVVDMIVDMDKTGKIHGVSSI